MSLQDIYRGDAVNMTLTLHLHLKAIQTNLHGRLYPGWLTRNGIGTVGRPGRLSRVFDL